MKYSVFTVSTPEFDFEETARRLSELGYDGVEWRVGDPPPIQPPEHHNFENRYWSFNKSTLDINYIERDASIVKELCDHYGLEICSLSANYNPSKFEEVKSIIIAADKIGCRQIRLFGTFYDGTRNYNEMLEDLIEDTKKLIPLSEEFNVKMIFEIHAGFIIPGASSAYRFASHFDPKNVGIIYDAGNLIYEGLENPKMGLEILGPYLSHVHLKNAVWQDKSTDCDGTRYFEPTSADMNKGYFDIKKLIQLLKEINYKGFLSTEDFSLTKSTEQKLIDNIKFLRSI